ncbi:MmgE/PrpD family protein [Chloroflexota bacterium]
MYEASQELARFVLTTKFQDLHDDVVNKTIDLILDHLGVSIFGSTTPWAQIVTRFVMSQGGKGASSIYASGCKSTPINAALANGTMAHSFELDDTLSAYHPGAVVIPAALAVAEREHSCGKDLITAIVLGYEVMARVNSAIHDTEIFRRGHHATGVTGSFGAAAASGKLLNLDEMKLVSALGLAANQHTGIMEFFREDTMEKRLFTGKACHDGVLSAMLAAEGFTAASSSLDGEYGFCSAFANKPDHAELTKNLGKTFKIMETEIKPYPCCRLIHSPIDAAIQLVEKYNISPQEISEVVLWGNKNSLSNQHCFYEVPGIMAAQYNIPYCIAIALIHRKVWIDNFTAEAFKESQTLELMRRVKVKYDKEIDRAGRMAKLTVKLANGRSFSETVYHSKGTTEHPFTKEELSEKFKMMTLMVLPQKQVDNIIRLTQTITDLRDITELANALMTMKSMEKE